MNDEKAVFVLDTNVNDRYCSCVLSGKKDALQGQCASQFRSSSLKVSQSDQVSNLKLLTRNFLWFAFYA